MKDHVLSVPFYSQYLDVTDRHWMVRSCGIVCLKMTFDYFGVDSPPPDELIFEGVAMGAYGDSGWYHDGLIAVAEAHGLSARREQDMDLRGIKAFMDELRKGNLVIISVVQRLLGRNKFHQVLLAGFREDAEGVVQGFYYHDPASSDREQGKTQYADLEFFLRDWRRMAIFLTH